MFLDKLTARSFPLALTAVLAACGGASDDTDATDDETDGETDGSGDDTVDTSGGGENLFELTSYSYFAQIGINADGLPSVFAVEQDVYATGLFVTLTDDEGTPSNTNDDQNCTFVYFPVTQQGFYSETDTEEVPTFPEEDTDYAAWVTDGGWLSAFGIWDGNYEVPSDDAGNFVFDDESGEPCPFAEDFAGLATAAPEAFLSDADGELASYFVGIGTELSDDLAERIEGSTLTAEEKEQYLAQWTSSYIRLPTEFQLQGEDPTRDLEAVSYGYEVDEDMVAVLDGQDLVPLESKDFSKGTGTLASPAIYFLSGRVTFGFAAE